MEKISLFWRKGIIEDKEEIKKLKNIIFKTNQSNMGFIEKINKLKTQRKKSKKIDNHKNRSVHIDNKLAKLNHEKGLLKKNF